MHDVEVVDAIGQEPRDTGAERLRLGEPGRAHGEELLDVHQVTELSEPRDPKGVRLAVEVEARDPGEDHAVVEVGVRRAREHLDVVAEPDQLPAQVADVDALAAAVRLAAVGQQCDAHAASPFSQ